MLQQKNLAKNLHPLGVVGRCSKTQIQVDEIGVSIRFNVIKVHKRGPKTTLVHLHV